MKTRQYKPIEAKKIEKHKKALENWFNGQENYTYLIDNKGILYRLTKKGYRKLGNIIKNQKNN